MKREDKNEFQNLIDKVKKGAKYTSAGSFKTCYTFADNPDYVVLKYDHQEFLKPCLTQKNLEFLNSLGVRTPRMVYYQNPSPLVKTLLRKPAYAVQEKAKGKQVYLVDNYSSRAIEQNHGKPSKEFLKTTHSDYCKHYNFQSFYSMLSGKKEHFDEVVRGYKLGRELGVMGDFNCANLFYDKDEGFTFIDLYCSDYPLTQSLTSAKNSNQIIDFASIFSRKLTLPRNMGLYNLYNNIMLHKIKESCDNPQLNLNENVKARTESFFNGYFDKARSDEWCCSDKYQAETLNKIIKLNPNTDFENLTDEEIEKLGNNTYYGMDTKYYLKCLTSFNIGDKTVFDYFRDYVPEKQIDEGLYDEDCELLD